MGNILEEIAEYKREFVARAKYEQSLVDVKHKALDSAEPADFIGALREP